MKWFKHMSDSLDDSFVQTLVDEFGPTGYMVWFGLLELIAKENGDNLTGKATFETRFVVRKLRTKSARCRQILGRIRDLGRIAWAESGNVMTIDCPKLLKLKDNYHKDLQATGKRLASIEAEAEGEAEVEADKNPHSPPRGRGFSYSEDFETFWKAYPRHDGKGAAYRAYKKAKSTSNQNGTFLQTLLASLEKHAQADQWIKDNGQFIPHASTFLNQRRWEDEPEVLIVKKRGLSASDREFLEKNS